MPSERSRRPSDRKLSEELGGLFGRIGRIWRHTMAEAVQGKFESMFETHLLMYLVREGPAAQSEIAAMCSQHPTAVSRMVDDLEARKLVRRHRDPHDRRKMRVEPTAEGRAQVEANRPVFQRALEEMLRGLDQTDRIALRDLLTKIAGAHEEPKPLASVASGSSSRG
jgi:DNA-binding MarR family transcriptional regulator